MHRQRFMRSGLSWLHCVFLTFVLVTSFGSVTYLTWSQQIETEATLVDRRLPASLLEEVNASSQSRGQDYKVQDIHLGCLRDSSVSAIESRAKLVRLVAESCEGQKIQDLKIANRSSGLSATIFKLENQVYSSDYLYLKKGENQILISLKGENGNLASTYLTVTRSY